MWQDGRQIKIGGSAEASMFKSVVDLAKADAAKLDKGTVYDEFIAN